MSETFDHALQIIEGWHQLANHLDRIVAAAPNMRVADARASLQRDFDRIEEIRRESVEG